MSRVTNVLLCAPLPTDLDTDERAIVELNEWLTQDAVHQPPLVEVTELVRRHVVKTKVMECCVYAAAFNHLDVDELKRRVLEAPWEEPEYVQLMIQDQDEDVFTVLTIEQLKAGPQLYVQAHGRAISVDCEGCGTALMRGQEGAGFELLSPATLRCRECGRQAVLGR